MQTEEIYSKLKSQFGDAIIELKDEKPSDAFIIVNADNLFDISLYLRDNEDLLFDYLMCLGGVDAGENLISVYHLYSMKHTHKIVLKVIVPKAEPTVPTVEYIWRSADWHEREAFDMFGIIYKGHHNLIRILCPYDWEGFPLRKDYQTPDFYHGIKVPY